MKNGVCDLDGGTNIGCRSTIKANTFNEHKSYHSRWSKENVVGNLDARVVIV